MENKPVIILGGGLWGGLLAYRLSELHPHLNFKLYERNSSLGGNQVWSFSEKDLPESALKWIRPFFTHSWNGHDLFFPSLSRGFNSPYHSISAAKFHEVITTTLKKERVKLNNELPLEIAAQEASFVIDARNLCHYKKAGHRKHFRVEIELENSHGLNRPVSMDAVVEQREGYRYLQYLPLSSHRLLIEDIRYCFKPVIDMEEMKQDIFKEIHTRGWKIKSIHGEHFQMNLVPMSAPLYSESDRVITLAGILHDTTGSSLSDAIKLIDFMVQSSFRYGELKSVVRKFREDREKDRRFFRSINRQLLKNTSPSEKYKIFQDLYCRPDQLVHRFSRGELMFWDRSLLRAKPSRTMIMAVRTLFPTSYSGRIALL